MAHTCPLAHPAPPPKIASGEGGRGTIRFGRKSLNLPRIGRGVLLRFR